MKIDQIDIKIIDVLYCCKEPMTSTEITKAVFSPKSREDVIKLNTKLNYRLQRMEYNGIVSSCIDEHRVKHYHLSNPDILFGESNIVIDHKQIFIGKIAAIPIKKDQYLIIFADDFK